MYGQVERKLDDKNRITLPTLFRDVLGSTFFLTIGFDGNAELRSIENFNEYVSTIEQQSHFNKDARTLRRMILGRAMQLSVDSHGRVLLPKNIIDSLAIQKDIIFIGVGSFVELWAKESYEKMETEYDDEKISQIAQSLVSS
ncbi:division/cell wall cluster transcriptional repressor MraZ [Mycoplasmopsis pullorum]|uniref:Transcriptional regulator MraZ n=1 Tax=Mycoplasmopsis pullorum TaxID=48003 RepID=A0A1L4FSS4_9BACT|nr:division/cell wall cluster transcriptional repressor MraZ [Mycoplasmopsis pullorum]APJ38663.1 cell division/cell wall cluster transcriptional repressor MraZ [Mycoplasmopsis pullorum]TNK81706.1 transcriptional regulator MraZ [Mycoplasmopsis pullorum]TNK82344.1 transcriptional regulator MraZ [Mycoplasmopsis pullorum]TNK82985.1 transcriptional regulator MraZ [Mycoplasmopsis pullorum]TNK84112.1 transcriptional regulator MraZ [Mycoplasmopsis pullorum]